MSWLDRRLDLTIYQCYELGEYVLLVSDQEVKWTRISKKQFMELSTFEGKRLKEIYLEWTKKKGIDQRSVLQFLKFFEPRKFDEQESLNYKEKSVFFLITRRCNLKCLTCYVATQQESNLHEMTLDEMNLMFDQLVEQGYHTIILSGGEPLIRKDIREIIVLAKKYFEKVHLNTNGLLLDQSMASFLKEQQIELMISLESFDPAVNDEIRGAGVYDKVMQTLLYLKKIEYKHVTISMTLTNMNLSQMLQMHHFCMQQGFHESYGIFVETGRGRCNSNSLKVDMTEQIHQYFNLIKEQAEIGDMDYTIPEVLTKCSTFCGAIMSIINIMPNGDVYPCPNLIAPCFLMGNILKDQLQTIISNSAVTKKIISRDVRDVNECNQCEIRYLCGGGCMANAYLHTDDIFGKDPMCAFYKGVLKKQLASWDLNKSVKDNFLAL